MSRRRTARRLRTALVAVLAVAALVLVVRWQWFPDVVVQHPGQPTGQPSAPAAAAGAVASAVVPPSGVPTSGAGALPSGATVPGPAASGSALAALGSLPVKGRAPRTGYDRAQFGQRWTDDVPVRLGHNGCDTRNDVLAEQLTDVRLVPGSGCRVATGVLRDPYTGREISFVRGPRSADVQIDHVVPLALAWQTGAQQLDPATRTAFANDPLNLLATNGAVNQRKGDSDAASWLPPDRSSWCGYVARQVAVRVRYHLWVTPPEKAAVDRVLARCPGQPLPTG